MACRGSDAGSGGKRMRARAFNWLGQQFLYLNLESEPGGSLEQQSQRLFERAGAELAARGFSMKEHVVRSRVFGRTSQARDVVSGVRGTTFTGQARAATSSYISPAHLTSGD